MLRLRSSAGLRLAVLSLVTAGTVVSTAPPAAAFTCGGGWNPRPSIITQVSTNGVNVFGLGAAFDFSFAQCATVLVYAAAVPIGTGVGTTCGPIPGEPLGEVAVCSPLAPFRGAATWGTPIRITWTLVTVIPGLPVVRVHTGECTVATPTSGSRSC